MLHDSVTTTSGRVETVALTRAAEFDRLGEDCGDDANDALIRVGELLGGWSNKGFVHDLQRELAHAEHETTLAWGERWPWLANEVRRDREAFAQWWLDEANAIMERAERDALSETDEPSGLPRWHAIYTADQLRERVYLAECELRHAKRRAQDGTAAAARLQHMREELTARLDADARRPR